jgi:Uma2 family endonuclease
MIDSMGHAQTTPIKMSQTDFLAWEDQQADRHEFVHGEVFAMVGGAMAHARVIRQLMRKIADHLDGSACEVFCETMKVVVEGNAVLYPDVVVNCGGDDRGRSLVAQAPVLIFEVISPSSRAYDTDDKAVLYASLESLKQYVVIDPVELTISSRSRQADGAWVTTEHSLDSHLPLPGIDMKLAVQDIFAAQKPY